MHHFPLFPPLPIRSTNSGPYLDPAENLEIPQNHLLLLIGGCSLCRGGGELKFFRVLYVPALAELAELPAVAAGGNTLSSIHYSEPMKNDHILQLKSWKFSAARPIHHHRGVTQFETYAFSIYYFQSPVVIRMPIRKAYLLFKNVTRNSCNSYAPPPGASSRKLKN